MNPMENWKTEQSQAFAVEAARLRQCMPHHARARVLHPVTWDRGWVGISATELP